ncbi:MAG: hypothetical protein V4812_02885 [Pseudomonadota bacterium]
MKRTPITDLSLAVASDCACTGAENVKPAYKAVDVIAQGAETIRLRLMDAADFVD